MSSLVSGALLARGRRFGSAPRGAVGRWEGFEMTNADGRAVRPPLRRLMRNVNDLSGVINVAKKLRKNSLRLLRNASLVNELNTAHVRVGVAQK